jgi:MFS superfamily sulfate permease-like transporter
VLGRIPGTTSWARPTFEPRAQEQPGVVVAMFATPIWYANADHFREEVADVLAHAPTPVRVLVLDTIGMSDIDFTGTRALTRVVAACERDGITLGIARAGLHLRESLGRVGLAHRIGEDRFFPTVNDAVSALASGLPPSAPSNASDPPPPVPPPPPERPSPR